MTGGELLKRYGMGTRPGIFPSQPDANGWYTIASGNFETATQPLTPTQQAVIRAVGVVSER